QPLIGPARASLREDLRALMGDRSGGRGRPGEGGPGRPAGSGAPGTGTGPGDRPQSPRQPVGARVALLVATRTPDRPGRPPDAVLGRVERLRATLAYPGIGGYAVTVLVQRTAQEVRAGIEEFLAARAADDLVLLHIAGPSLLDARAHLHLCAADTDPDLF